MQRNYMDFPKLCHVFYYFDLVVIYVSINNTQNEFAKMNVVLKAFNFPNVIVAKIQFLQCINILQANYSGYI